MERRTDRLKRQEKKFQETPDIVVKVVCKYRAELFFKISRKTKLSRLFNAWTERMDLASDDGKQVEPKGSKGGPNPIPPHFLFTYRGRVVESIQTPEEIGLEESDEILAVEMLDLTRPDTVGSPHPPTFMSKSVRNMFLSSSGTGFKKIGSIMRQSMEFLLLNL